MARPGEDGHLGEAGGAELAGRLAERHDDRVRGRVVGLVHAVRAPGDHRLVDHGDAPRPAFHARPRSRLRERLAHEQLVVHADDHSNRHPRSDRPDPYGVPAATWDPLASAADPIQTAPADDPTEPCSWLHPDVSAS